jgi:predicted metal-binding membrane protein
VFAVGVVRSTRLWFALVMPTAPDAFLATWSVAMAAMMLPSEWPLVRLDHATSRSTARSAALVTGYLLVWCALGAVVLLADWLSSGWVLGMHGRVLTASVLLAAAAYQLTPLKLRCLGVCRAPLARIMYGWRDGIGGAVRMGAVNGLWCIGCCVGLMAALLVVGMMNELAMVLVAAAVCVEKATLVGVSARRVAAVGLAAGAVAWAT